MPRLAQRPLRIDQFNTHFTRAEYRKFLILAEARGQELHTYLREAIEREYRTYVRSHTAPVRDEIAARVDAYLAEVDASVAARRAQATSVGRHADHEGPPAAPRTNGHLSGRRGEASAPSAASPTQGQPSTLGDIEFRMASKAERDAERDAGRDAGRRAPATQPLKGDRADDAWVRAHERAFGAGDDGASDSDGEG